MRSLLALACFLPGVLPAQSGLQPPPASFLFVFQPNEILGSATNPAALAGVRTFSVGTYSERRFLLSSLQQHQLMVAVPGGRGAFGASLRLFGEGAYAERTATFAYGRTVSGRFELGVQANYHQVQAGAYGVAHTISGGVGVRAKPWEGVQIALTVDQIGGRLFRAAEEEKWPLRFGFHLGYRPAATLLLAAGVEKEEGWPGKIVAGLYYRFHPRLWAIGGIHTEPGLYFMGAGVQLASLQLTLLSSLHPRLGLSPALQLGWRKKGKDE